MRGSGREALNLHPREKKAFLMLFCRCFRRVRKGTDKTVIVNRRYKALLELFACAVSESESES